MNKNAMRPNSHVAVVAAKPPKPPCWRDFVTPHSRVPHVNEVEFTDIAKAAKSSNESHSSDGQINNKSGKPKRVRAKIHRTRSQFTIEEDDLPEGTLTVTLAETKPDDLGLRRQPPFDERVFQEDNNRKCQTWLASIEACKPLEDISTSGSAKTDPGAEDDGEPEGVSIEVPDDTRWYHQMELRPPYNSSASGSDCEGNKSPRRPRSVHRSKSYETRQEKGSGQKDHKHKGGDTRSSAAKFLGLHLKK